MKILSQKEWFAHIQNRTHPERQTYRAMFSTWWGGIVTDPNLMMIPIDDHQVHRGDAVFEALKVINGKFYLGNEHLDRLELSAKSLSLKIPMDREELIEALRKTLEASKLSEASVRVFVSRGPGSFSANPYDTLGAQVNIVVMDFKPVSSAWISKGVTVLKSEVKVKDPHFARVKSCNYLPNVLMKKEAVDWGVDFTIGVNEAGFVTEASTENIIYLDKDSHLIRPLLEGILAGTTMARVLEMVEDKGLNLPISRWEERQFSMRDLTQAKEVMMVGTTLDVLSVVRVDGVAISNSKPGPVAQALREALLKDQAQGQHSL